jgi:hypothetical protein
MLLFTMIIMMTMIMIMIIIIIIKLPNQAIASTPCRSCATLADRLSSRSQSMITGTEHWQRTSWNHEQDQQHAQLPFRAELHSCRCLWPCTKHVLTATSTGRIKGSWQVQHTCFGGQVEPGKCLAVQVLT